MRASHALAAAQQETSTGGLSPEEFRARLVAARLSHPLTDRVYSLQAARIKYVPFQFRPLLRLARADEPRLLIADDVGVGATIEAGLILMELAARQPLDGVLVLYPRRSRLTAPACPEFLRGGGIALKMQSNG